MTTFKWMASTSLAAVLFHAAPFPALRAEAHCPGSAASIRPRFVDHSLIAIPVMVEDTGPYDFVVDTGSQLTIIDPQLASEVHAQPFGATHVTGVGTYFHASYAQLSSLAAGTNSLRYPLVLVQDLQQIQRTDPHIRGVLGANFLERFDLLIDYQHLIVCLDATKQMQQKMKGEHIALIPPPHPDRYMPFTLPMIVSARLSEIPGRPVFMQLDSGINVPVLFEYGKQLRQVETIGTSQRRRHLDEVTQAFAVLAPQDINVGSHSFHQIAFMTPVATGKEIPVKPHADGLLPTILFRSVFISYANHFAVLQP